MKLNTLLSAVMIMTLIQPLWAQKDQLAKMPAAVKKITGQMVLVEPKSFVMNNVDPARISTADSTLIASANEHRVTVSAFYISKTEVTNLEYRIFCQDIVNKHGKDAAAKYLPDMLIWENEFPNSYFKPMVDYYHSHPAYDHYPVVGVSWEQANAYCAWLSEKVNEELKAAGKALLPNFRLPSEAEWESAALGKNIKDAGDVQPYFRFGWGSSELRNKKGQLLGNFRFLPDRNGFVPDALNYADNTSITAPSNSYLPNSYGIYNMSGNVSEWVQDVLRIDIPGLDDENLNPFRNNSAAEIKEKPDFNKMLEIYQLNGADAAAEFMLNEMKRLNLNKTFDTDVLALKYKTETLIPFVTDFVRFAKKSTDENYFRVVKGGSWFDGPYSLQIGARHCLQQQKCSARTGFRLAMNKI